ncbi:MAG: DUF6323 family protein [Evtepia sp.]
MADPFALETLNMQLSLTVEELRECNYFTGPVGLRLSETEIRTLAAQRVAALKETGRMEFGAGILKKLIQAFYDSPYLLQENYEATLIELQESFYFFKNESNDLISDDDLIAFMRCTFDDVAQGSLDYLASTSLQDLCKNARQSRGGDYD